MSRGSSANPTGSRLLAASEDGFSVARCCIHRLPVQLPKFEFVGTAVGAFVTAGPDAGQLEVQIDDGDWQTIETYHRFSKGLHYPRTVMFATDLDAGEHVVRLKIAGQKHTESNGHAVRIIGFAINGIQ